jgi:thymidylate synthase
MFTAEYEGINSFLVGASSLLLKHGVRRRTRGFDCWELPAPFMFKISNPTSRWITIPQRKWNSVLPYAESLWLASGRNDLEMIGSYFKKMREFSDDGSFIRGGYGPRLRRYNGNSLDYNVDDRFIRISDEFRIGEVDQFSYVISSFKRDQNTRQAIINIGDPPKDCFDTNGYLKETKDSPCTRLLHFMKHPTENKLNLTVYMRSNDILWGASAVNIFNFTFIQEYIARILNLEVGDYFHVANNFHFYDDKREMIENISCITDYKDESFSYNHSFRNLNEFDLLIKKLEDADKKLRFNKRHDMEDFGDDFFNDWYRMLYQYHSKRKVDFINPILNHLINS